MKNQRAKARTPRALPGISLSTRERARFIIDTAPAGGRTRRAASVLLRSPLDRQTMSASGRTEKFFFFTSPFFNLILHRRHVFITPLFDRGNRQRVARAIFDPHPHPMSTATFRLITLKSKIPNLIFRRVARPDPRGFSAAGNDRVRPVAIRVCFTQRACIIRDLAKNVRFR